MTKSKRKQKTRRWATRQQQDPYVRQARQEGYRARAVYKLAQADKKYRLVRPGQVVVDLGAAPGSWSQYTASKVGKNGLVLAIDLLHIAAIENACLIQGDFTEPEVQQQITVQLGGCAADLVLSDIAPNITGIRVSDQAKTEHLISCVFEFCQQSLIPGGSLLLKMLEGDSAMWARATAKRLFKHVDNFKPAASRRESREIYLVARGFVAGADIVTPSR